jgi:DNA-binding MarR family transcriptional regulator
VEPSQLDESTGPIGEVLDIAADLMIRYLVDRAGLSVSASLLLNRVDREGPTRLTALAAAEGISQPAMTQLIQRMERHGLVERLSDPDDRRAALVTVTEVGRALLAQRTGKRRNRFSDLMATVPSEDVFALWLSAQVAQPILRQLLEDATAPAVTSAQFK